MTKDEGTSAPLQTIEKIFYAALEQEPDHVAPFLETACEGDELLRRKVETLLASRDQVANFIETPAVGTREKLLRTSKLTCSSDRLSGTTKF